MVAELTDEFKQSKSVAFADYRGLTVAQADQLRKKARESGVRYIVTKKSLFNIAAKAAGYDLDARKLEGMISAAFGHEDEIAPAKLIGDLGKKASIRIIGGIFEGQVIPVEKMIALSKLPGKQELLGMVVGTIYAPVSAFVRLLNAIREEREKNEAKPAVAPKAEEIVAVTEAMPVVAPVPESPIA